MMQRLLRCGVVMSGLLLAIGCGSVSEAAAAPLPPPICQQVLEQIEQLPVVVPTVVDDASATQLVELAASLQNLAQAAEQSAQCANSLMEEEGTLASWAAGLAARSQSATKESAAEASAARVLDPNMPTPTPGACAIAEQLIVQGEFDRAAALLSELKASGDTSLTACVAKSQVSLALAEQQHDDGTAADSLSDWYDRYVTSLLALLAWGVAVGGGILLLFRLRSAFRPADMTGSDQTRAWVRGNVLIAAALWVVTLVLALFRPGTGNPGFGSWLGILILATTAGLVLLRPKVERADMVRVAMILLSITIVLNAALDPSRASMALLNLVTAGMLGVALGQLSWLRRTRLIVGSFGLDAEPGSFEQMDQLLIAEMRRIGDGQSRRIDVVGGTDIDKLPFDLASGVELTKFVQFFVGVWQYLVPGGDWRLDGVAHASGTDTPTISVRLRRGRNLVASETFATRLFAVPAALLDSGSNSPAGKGTDNTLVQPPVVPVDNLLTAVAAWIILNTRESGDAADVRLYGATSWRSLALTVAAERRRRPAESEYLLSRACDLDPNNLAAAFNLLAARAEQVERRGDINAGYEDLIRDLTGFEARVGNTLKLAGPALDALPLIWRLRYSLGATRLNRVMLKITDRKVPWADTEFAAVALELIKARDSLTSLVSGIKHPEPSDTELAEQFRWLAGAAILGVDGVEHMIGATLRVDNLARIVAMMDQSVGPRHSFTVCCALLAHVGEGSIDEIRPELRRLIQRFSADPEISERALSLDPAFFRLHREPELRWLKSVLGVPASRRRL